MGNLECPDCKEIGWSITNATRLIKTIVTKCTLCNTVTGKTYGTAGQFHKALCDIIGRQIKAGVVLLGSEVMENTGWDDCNVYKMIELAARAEIPEGC